MPHYFLHVLKTKYSKINWSIQRLWLLLIGLLESPAHWQAWYCMCKIKRSIFSNGKNLSTCVFSVLWNERKHKYTFILLDNNSTRHGFKTCYPTHVHRLYNVVSAVKTQSSLLSFHLWNHIWYELAIYEALATITCRLKRSFRKYVICDSKATLLSYDVHYFYSWACLSTPLIYGYSTQ